MKKGNLLDKIVAWGIRLAPLITFNQAVYPEVINRWAESWEKNGIPKVNLENVELSNLENKSFDARNYLDLANSIVHQNVLEGAVCRDYVKATLEIYERLIKQAEKDYLIDCIESVYDRDHNWIGVREGGEWVKYETMHKTPSLTIDNVREHSNSTERQREYLNGNPNRKAHSVCHPNSNCHSTLDAYFQEGGNLALLAKAFLKD